MLDKYGCRVTAPSQPTGAQRETLLIEVRGVRFGKITVDFLAFLGGFASAPVRQLSNYLQDPGPHLDI